MTDREQALERALSLIVTTNLALTFVRKQRGNLAAQDTKRAAVREFNLAIERARALLAERRASGALDKGASTVNAEGTPASSERDEQDDSCISGDEQGRQP
jgi:hypothetical protein